MFSAAQLLAQMQRPRRVDVQQKALEPKMLVPEFIGVRTVRSMVRGPGGQSSLVFTLRKCRLPSKSSRAWSQRDNVRCGA